MLYQISAYVLVRGVVFGGVSFCGWCLCMLMLQTETPNHGKKAFGYHTSCQNS